MIQNLANFIRSRRRYSWLLPVVALVTGAMWGSVSPAAWGEDIDDRLPNIATPTLGGKMFWGDNFIYAGWRIQENMVTGHHRLLDPDDVRQAWGTYRQCLAALTEIRAEQDIRPAGRHLVLLLHGLGRSKDSFGDVPEKLRAAGYEVVGLNYPSFHEDAEASARRLNLVLDRTEGVDRISFATHSLGSIILRVALAQDAAWRDRIALHRAVLFAPPSNGSAIADLLGEFPPFGWIVGDIGQDLTTEAARQMPGLSMPFGIIAGGRGDGEGFNPLIEGDDDGTLAIAETRLAGALDFKVVNSIHSFVHTDPEGVEAMLSFLASGCFTCP